MNQLPTPPRGYSFRPGPLVRLVKVDVVGLQPFLLRAQIVARRVSNSCPNTPLVTGGWRSPSSPAKLAAQNNRIVTSS
jgi:hypothetical protein